MSLVEEFRPRWASPPGDSIGLALAERHWDIRRLSTKMGVSEPVATGLLDGSTRVTLELARSLAGSLGGSTRFWILRDAKYRESLDWVEADRWVSLLPTKDMLALGWLQPFDDWQSHVTAFMEFFGVDSPSDLRGDRVRAPGVRYRAKPQTLGQDAAISAWVRKVEVEAQALQCGGWDSSAFQELFPQLAALSRIPDPRVFVPKLQQICSAVGVAVVVIRPPRGCPVNGVSMMSTTGVRTIGLSGRYLSDDHLWFTFFHEAGHLILHNPDLVFIDEIERVHSAAVRGPEKEADHLASETLLPAELRASLAPNVSPYTIHGLARSAGVSNGVVVGQLQHAGHVQFKSALNRLKHRYRWEGSLLTRGNG